METNFFDKTFLATGVGSLPHGDARRAVDFIEANFKEQIVFWPQLTKRSFKENMYVQFSERLPGVVVEEENRKIYLDTASENFLKEMEESYLHASKADYEYFAISPEYAAGFYEMLSRDKLLNGLEYFKGQIIGPISFGLTITDQQGQAIIYNPDLSEILVKVLAMKIKWQIRKIKKQNPKLKIIIFIDEPYLVSLGTSFTNIKKEKIIGDINELIKVIHDEGALAGIHCCGNTDWGIVLNTQLDILNFDAYNYLTNLLLFSKDLQGFLDHQGILAWGIVPNDEEALQNSTTESLVELIDKAKPKDILRNKVLITPSCGCGTLSEALAEKVHQLAVQVAVSLAKKNY